MSNSLSPAGTDLVSSIEVPVQFHLGTLPITVRDPTIKSKRKQLHQEMIQNNTVENVRKSTVLVTNPTHRAIALYYQEGETKLPDIKGMGEGALAQRMIEVVKKEGIPSMRNIPLAHDLFNNGQVDQYIPRELIQPIAEVLRWVRSLQAEET